MTNVWTYWEGPRPDYIDLCLRSMRSVCSAASVNFYLVTPDNLGEFVFNGALHKNYQKLEQPALRADCIRAALLALHGGFWWDADTVGWNNPRRLLDQYPDATSIYTSWKNPPFRILNGYIYFAHGNPIAQEWLSKINHGLKYEFHNATWLAYGEGLLTSLLPLDKQAVAVPREVFLPIDVDSNVKSFFEAGDPVQHVCRDTVCYGLNHSWFVYHKHKQILSSPATWASSPLLIHRLLSHALSML